MPGRVHKQMNRRAIYGALVIWVAVQVTQLLKPVGIPLFAPSSLLIAGLIAYPGLVLWPLVKGFLKGPARVEPEESAQQRRVSTLISVQIVALSSMLVAVLFHL